MNQSGEIFARIIAELEDLHCVAVDGQAADQTPEAIAVLSIEICNGLQRVGDLFAEVRCIAKPLP
ncbi:hypothetical protein GRI34_00270 [Erythrobacter aquimaris]|uniref:Uncharacterized protein n=1 Tax=Qipengyuania aquimaris TaxID=255984 RepID=A0A6I4TI51_9SPHN|nr:hypothetical protein [Qipengyuania aquimaris]MXO94850.1 hypothetical protein [Qipengyuania aquimaris]